jgi:hypothetical protein
MARPIPFLACCAALVLVAAGARAQESCPAVETPPGSHVEQVATDLTLNGQHSRVARFSSGGSDADILAFYRTRFGARHVENVVAGARVIAARQGGCFVTVRIAPAGAGPVEATVIATRLGAGSAQSRVALDTRNLLPAGTSVLQTQESVDNGTQGVLLVAANGLGLQADVDALAEQFRARGFRIQREDTARIEGRASMSLSLASASEEATVTVSDAGPWRALVIHRTRRAP